MASASVVLDFDGTIALGDGPLGAYARCVGEIAGARAAEACRTELTRFASGMSEYRDGYAAVQGAAHGCGVSDKDLSTAYMRSREQLATDAAPIHPPDGLTEFIRALQPHARCIVATNAPSIGIDRALDILGIAPLVDELYTSVGKPAGLPDIIAASLAHGPTLAVGDIWENDLAPAQRLGADTAFVGVGTVAGRPTMRGVTLTDLYDDILAWARANTEPTQPTINGEARPVNDVMDSNRAMNTSPVMGDGATWIPAAVGDLTHQPGNKGNTDTER